MPTNPTTANLVSWWAMDETSGTRADSHGSYDLTDNNTVLSAAGKQSNAADFERDNSESLSLSTNIVVADGNPWTLAGWLKFETVTNATFASHDYTPGNYWRFYRTGTTVVLYSDDNSQSLSWSWSPSAATWYHLALSCDGAGNLTLRVDGTSLGAGAMSKSGLVLARFATLPLAGWYFDGLYDEWAVFDDELTQDEIDWLVNSGAGRAYSELLVSPSTDNLVSWWALDEASGTRADSHGANDLTDNNTVLSAAGKQSNAADFEFGNNEYLSIADNAALSVGDVDWTILGWGQIESFTDVVIQTLASKYIGFDREFRFSVFKVGAGNWQAQLNVRNTANTAEQNNNATDFGALSTGTWYLFSARHDSVANTITVGVNTTHTATAWSGGIRDSAQPFMLGGDGDAGRTWDGLLDEWAVFKSAAGGGGALSDDEIAWLYNSGAGRAYSELLVNPTTANLVSWWAMESGALTVDSHGSNTLTDNNTVGEGAAKVGTASAQYTGTNNEYHSLASIALAAGTDWTVAGWIKADSWTGGAGAMLGHTASSPNATRFHIWSNGGEIIYTTPLAISWRVNHTFNLGQWYHCAVVATSNTSMKIYVDGVAIYTVGASTYGFEFTEIGRLLASNTYSLDGALDEWAIFDGHALSAAEIAWLYNSGAGRAYSELLVNPTTANLVSWWALDETSGTRADSHGTNHLTDNNTVLSAAGKQSNAADFELSNSEYLSAANHASLQLSASWSMCGWLQHESAPSGSGMHWVGKYQGGTNYYTLSTALGTGKISWGVGASAIDSPITPTLGQWYFVAVWIESGVSYIQVNNGTISSVAAPDPLPLPNASLNLGSLAGVAGLVDGLMDEWAIWQNRTLTAGERAWLYNSGAGRAYSELAGVGGVIFGGIGGTLVRGIGTRGLVRA